MDGTGDTMAHWLGSFMSVKGEAGLAFAAFVFRHTGCGGELIESRLGEDLLACWCLQCENFAGKVERDQVEFGRPA